MSDRHDENQASDGGDEAVAAVARPKARPVSRRLPPFKLLLHNDDVNDMLFVVEKVFELTPLTVEEAVERMIEAHHSGVALLLVTHKERAELYQEQFRTYDLMTSIEPDA